MGLFDMIGKVTSQVGNVRDKARNMTDEQIAEQTMYGSPLEKETYLKILKQRVSSMSDDRALQLKQYLDRHSYLTDVIDALEPIFRQKDID